ncbi:MAG TPA: endonuclease/exonuclease/phosphatase family protein [Streptosporangiaceae bacterium]|jgi:endonuclease/exonuclease/phosphatase (EEP) superfamily protein YafD|nr:endonuclease/exonuclease/phosphatase family protein [Streptosporangiaceae bacterium]
MSSSRLEWAVAGCVAGWAVARLTAADRFRPLEQVTVPLLALTPHAAVAAGVAALLLRRKGPSATAALAGAALAAVVAPRAIPRRQPAADGPVLRVLTVNLLTGRAAGGQLVELVRSTGADVLFLQELDEDAVSRLKQAGLGDLLPYEMADIVGYRYRGSGIYARYPLQPGLTIGPSYASQPTARLDLPWGSSVQLVCVHPHPPMPPWHAPAAPRWRGELAALPPPGDVPVILAGDYNATLDHAQFRRLLRLGHADAASQVGNGLVPTWGPEPHGRPPLLPFDHVLVDPRCAVLATSTHLLPGSDHRALYAEFRLPA